MGPYTQDPLTQFVQSPEKPENNLHNREGIPRKENLAAHRNVPSSAVPCFVPVEDMSLPMSSHILGHVRKSCCLIIE